MDVSLNELRFFAIASVSNSFPVTSSLHHGKDFRDATVSESVTPHH